MTADYAPVSKALASGVDPAMLCGTCPWDRYCVVPPSMSKADIEAQIQEAQQKDQEANATAVAAGQEPKLPLETLMTAMMFGGRDTSATVCPVFALRLRSRGGRAVADHLKDHMQSWDDARAEQ